MQCASFTQSRWVLLCTHVNFHFRFKTDSGRHEMCPLQFLLVLSSAKNTSWMTSLWREATSSYSGGISGEILNSAGLDRVRKFGSQPVKLFEIFDFSTFSLTSFSISVSTVIRKERSLNGKPLKWSNLILQRWNQWRNSKLFESRSSSARNEWIFFEIYDFSQPVGIFTRTFSLTSFCF